VSVARELRRWIDPRGPVARIVESDRIQEVAEVVESIALDLRDVAEGATGRAEWQAVNEETRIVLLAIAHQLDDGGTE
jgi:hypothetical protein